MKRLALAILALCVGAVVWQALRPVEPSDGNTWSRRDTTYSPGPAGTKAFYLLLEQLGLPVVRLRRPDYASLPPTAALWNLSAAPIGAVERSALLDFVRAGGTFLAGEGPMQKLMVESSLGEPSFAWSKKKLHSQSGLPVEADEAEEVQDLPAPERVYIEGKDGYPVVAAWKVGKGRLVFLGIRGALANEEIGKGNNGSFFANLAFDSGTPQVFDEFATGLGDLKLSTVLLRAPYRFGLAQAVLAFAVLITSLAVRRLPARAPERIRRRQTAEHVDAVARFWERAGDVGLPLESLLRAASDRARRRLSLHTGEEAFVRWVSQIRPELASRAVALWGRASDLAAQASPSPERCRESAEQLARLEAEALSW
jgi:hypothetical protein